MMTGTRVIKYQIYPSFRQHLQLSATVHNSQVDMNGRYVQYDGGDVLIKPSWKSSDFFLVHRNIHSDRSPFSQAMLADRWNKRSNAGLNERATPLLTLYISRDTSDSKNPTFILTANVRACPIQARCRSFPYTPLSLVGSRRAWACSCRKQRPMVAVCQALHRAPQPLLWSRWAWSSPQ